MLYGNIYDYYYYENRLMLLDEVIEELSNYNIIKSFYTENSYNSAYKNLISSSDNNSSEECDLAGYQPVEGLMNVNILRDKILNFENEDGKRKVVYIKNPLVFFSDTARSGNNDEYIPGQSIHYFNEFSRKLEDDNILIIMVADKLKNIPRAIYEDNPDAAVLHISYPESEIREVFIKEHIDRNMIFENYFDIVNDYVHLTADRTLKEIQKIFLKGIPQGLDPEKPKEFVDYYDFGEVDSPWTKLKLEEIKNLDKRLSERVLGQDHAIDFVKKVMVRAKLGLTTVHQSGNSTRPIGIFFFVGPTGVGKTELAKAMADAIFRSEKEFKRFDMSEYKEESLNKLIGASPGYIGYEEGGQLTNWVDEHPFSVILFDEIEKANGKIWDTFLQILEDGRLTSSRGKTVHFNEAVVIFTSNLGQKEASNYLSQSGNNYNEEELHRIYQKSVKDYFKDTLGRSEILNRIGNNIVPFNHINNEEIYRRIARLKIETIVSNIAETLDCHIQYGIDIIDFIIDTIISSREKFGGRAVVNNLETYFINEFGLFYIDRQPDSCEAYIDVKRPERISFR